MDWTEQPGRDGHHFVEILHLEAITIDSNERLVVVRRLGGPGVKSCVEYVDLDVILSKLEKF